MILNRIFYLLKPLIPRALQIELRRSVSLRKLKSLEHIWPIDPTANKKPTGWSGWPYNKRFALILTHDVDTSRGQERCRSLAVLEKNLGFRSSFNFVPERYPVSTDLRHWLTDNGFEVGVHGLVHDGRLYDSREIFKRRARRINHYIAEWGAVGFRSPAMHHNLEWIHDLNIEYDASTFDTDPFEPQSDGIRTIFPFMVREAGDKRGYIELPYTLPQDFTLFVIMKEKGPDIWKRKIRWIAEHGGMALLNTHPDYMRFTKKRPHVGEYPCEYYEAFLHHLKTTYDSLYWHVLPREIAAFWRHAFHDP